MVNGVTKVGGVKLAVDDSRQDLGDIQERRASIAFLLDQGALPCNHAQSNNRHTCEHTNRRGGGWERVRNIRLLLHPPGKNKTPTINTGKATGREGVGCGVWGVRRHARQGSYRAEHYESERGDA